MYKIPSCLLFLLLWTGLCGASLSAQDLTGGLGDGNTSPLGGAGAADFVLGLPGNTNLGQTAWPGLRLEYDFLPSPWGVELGYAFRAKEYFTFNHQTHQWSGPLTWQQTDSGGHSEGDWPFYHTRHVISPGLLFRPSFSWVQPRVGLGLLIQFYVPGEAQDYYPDFQQSFRDFESRTQALFGNYLKFGLELPHFSWLNAGFDFVFEVPDWGRFYSDIQERAATYAQAHSHWELRLGVRL